jgi:DNA primase
LGLGRRVMQEQEKPPIVMAILKEKKITDLLESRGIHPERESGSRLSYLCPIHEGDTTPSFIVFDDGEYQTYKCFGCHSGTDVINLVCDLDHVSLGKAIQSLSDGLTIEQANILATQVINGQKIVSEEYSHNKQLEIMMLQIGSFCRSYLNRYDKDNEEDIEFFFDMYRMIDKVAREKDLETLKGMWGILQKYNFAGRRKLYFERKEKKILDGVKVWKK